MIQSTETLSFYKTFDGISVKTYCQTSDRIIPVTPGMKFEDLLKKIFPIK